MKNLQATLTVAVPAVDCSSVLQLLEAGRSSGTVRLGELSLRLCQGRVVKACRDGDRAAAQDVKGCLDVVRAILGASGVLTFRAVSGEPTGPLSEGLTGLLLQVASATDEASR